MPKLSVEMERALHDADTSLQFILTMPKELTAAEFHELKNVHHEFDIIRRSIGRKK